ncbi:hypothetical protein [Pontibacter roseus]|uniref:hypothetical protein n=1 Tax=Pontibacter roseus TaxID=336989 RepID=UPI000369E20F|nr:hypothetical protein [Pontibacter roseus]
MKLKRLTFAFVAALLACGAQAQTTKGTVALTGKLGYTHNKVASEAEKVAYTNNSENHSYTFAPGVGVFVKDNLEIGASVSLNSYKYEHSNEQPSYPGTYTSSHQEDTREKHAGVYARQYKFLTQRFAAHVTLSAGLGSSRSETVNSSYNQSSYSNTHDNLEKTIFSTIAISPGLSFFASEKVGISVHLGALRYSRRDFEAVRKSTSLNYEPQQYEGKHQSNVLELDFSSMNLNFGLTYFIGR